MTSHSDIDVLIATLHPHILKCLFNERALVPASSLTPDKDTTAFQKLLQAFATLFSSYPGCADVVVTAQARQPSSTATSLYICLSSSIPDGFDKDVDQWLTHFMGLRQQYCTSSECVQPKDTLSESEKCFVLDVYRRCYPAMRERTKSRAKWFQGLLKMGDAALNLEKDTRNKFQDLCNLIHDLVETISGDIGSKDEDMLRFHDLCLKIHNMILGKKLNEYLEEDVYPGGIDEILECFCLPIELSILVELSRTQDVALDGKWSSHIMDPLDAAREFSAVVTETNLTNRFGEAHGIKWEEVVRAFTEFAQKDYGKGYEWDTNKNRLSTSEPVAIYPEITLILHLLDPKNSTNFKKEAETYIACSKTPCYASVRYVGAVNHALKTRFTMRANHSDWCRLHKAEPWILPEVTKTEVVVRMKDGLLWDLKKLIRKRAANKSYFPDATRRALTCSAFQSRH